MYLKEVVFKLQLKLLTLKMGNPILVEIFQYFLNKRFPSIIFNWKFKDFETKQLELDSHL